MFFKKRPKEPTPGWMKWVYIGFFLFALLSYHNPQNAQDPNPLRKAISKVSGDLKKDDALNYSNYKEMILPSHVGALRINDTKLGSGLPAVCGQEVTVSFQSWLDKDNKIEEATSEKPLTFIIGDGAVMPIFEHGVIGMQPGGTRSIIAPMQLSYGAKGFERKDIAPGASVLFDMTLIGVTPPLPNPDTSPYRIATTRSSSGRTFICGETVSVQLTMWDMQGNKIFTTYGKDKAPLNFTLGRSQVFSGLEQGVVGMRAGEIRTLIVPPSFQKPLRANKDAVKFPLPKNQTIVVDVELIP